MSRREPKKRIKTAKGRTTASTRWLERQLNDPYVERAKREGKRSRAAYKLIEMDEKLGFLEKGKTVIDLGAAPGGWSQYAAEKGCEVIGLDLLPIDPMPDVTFLQMDFMEEEAYQTLLEMTSGGADIVMSDMAPNTTGHKKTDHIRIMALVEAAYYFAREVLKPDGIFVAKVFQGGAQNTLLAEMKKDFKSTRHIKPPSSRADSSETFLYASGFRGA